RILVLGIMLLAGLIAAPLLPETWWNRQKTTLEYEDDGSAMSRIDNWKFCWKVAEDRPLVGGGFRFHSPEIFARYAPEFVAKYPGKEWDTHNIYRSMLASHGFPGFFAFSGMIGVSLLSCERMQRAVRGRPECRWIVSYCRMIQI